MIFSLQVSALGLDPSGARLITGGYDYDVRFWDFAGMDASLQAFRSLQPCEWYILMPLFLKKRKKNSVALDSVLTSQES